MAATEFFPAVASKDLLPPDQVGRRTLEGWKNHSSAHEEAEVLEELVQDDVSRGFDASIKRPIPAILLGGEPVLNKLGVMLKIQKDSQRAGR